MSNAAEVLRAEVETLPELSVGACSPSERTWREHANAIRKCILCKDPNTFLTWQPIISTMAAQGHRDWSLVSQYYLESLPGWDTRWKPAITEVSLGTPTYHGITSNALVIAAHCLALFEQNMGVKLSNLSFVLEFGGGYGCLCRVLYALGFHGDYVNYDQTVIAALARYYLTELGLPPNGCLIKSISDFTELNQSVDVADLDHSLFVSHWALSEVPTWLRFRMLSLARNFKYIYLIYQPEFYEVNNLKFFAALPSTFEDIDWRQWDIKHLGATALVGTKRP